MKIDQRDFWRRVSSLKDEWDSGRTNEESPFLDINSLCFITGKQDTENQMSLSEMLHVHLFGFTFTDTLLVFTKSKIYAVCTKKKLGLLQPLAENKVGVICDMELVLLEKSSDLEKTDAHLKTVMDEIKAEGPAMGTLLKSTPVGEFGEKCIGLLKSTEVEQREIEVGLYSILSIQDENETLRMRDASILAVRAMKKSFLKQMLNIVDDEAKVKHSTIAENIEKAILENTKIDKDFCDVAYFPTVQSGSSGYNLTPGADSDDNNLSYDNIICSLGVKFKEFNTHLARTFLIDPTTKQKELYKLAVRVQNMVIAELRPGTELGKVYKNALEYVKKKNPSAADYFLKNVGWAIGLPFRNKTLVIKGSNTKKVRTRMSFSVCVGFENVPFSEEEKKSHPTIKDGKYSILLADTVYINVEDNQELTAKSSKESDRVCFYMDGEDSGSDEQEQEQEDVAAVGEGNIIGGLQRRATRSQFKTKDELMRERLAQSQEARIAKHQAELIRKKAKEAENAAEVDVEGAEEKQIQIANAYGNSSAFPTSVQRNQIFCDAKHESVLLPISGCHVPFHISTIKSVSKSDEEKATFIRLNLYYPTSSGSFSRDTPPQARELMTRFGNQMYIKEMSFRSRDSQNLNHQLRLIKELQKRVRARQKKKEEEADLVEQAKLIISTDRSLRVHLDDVNMRPSLHKGKCIGRLTAHVNGFRFRARKGEQLDIIYSNIKHFFFQPCKKELIVLVHFNLKHPIMIGRTKSYDVQFFTEVIDGSTALDGRRRSDYDPDEIDEEFRERQLRKRLNKMFLNFCQKVIKVCEKNDQTIGPNNDVDTPFRKLMFQGVPNKEMVWLSPTLYCLVNLTEAPFFCLSLDDVEHIHFERVDFRIVKNFDMVIILKRHMALDNEEVPQRIQTIPMQNLEKIKSWIDEKGDLTFTFGNTSLNWKAVMLGVREEIRRGVFWKSQDEEGEAKDIGWKFLDVEGDDEQELEGDGSGSESDYQEDSGSEEEEEEEEEESEEEFDESEGSEGESEDEDAPSWDELEKQAARADKKKTFGEDDGDRHSRKKKRRR